MIELFTPGKNLGIRKLNLNGHPVTRIPKNPPKILPDFFQEFLQNFLRRILQNFFRRSHQTCLMIFSQNSFEDYIKSSSNESPDIPLRIF